jgi:hypothetical protein
MTFERRSARPSLSFAAFSRSLKIRLTRIAKGQSTAELHESDNFSTFVSSFQKSCFLKAEETPAADHSLADDDVIQEMDLKNLRGRRDAFGDL